MPAFKKIFRQMFSRKQDFPGVVISHPSEEWIDSKARDFALIEELERRAGIREFLRRRGFVKREYRVKLLGLYPDLDWHGDFGKWKVMAFVSADNERTFGFLFDWLLNPCNSGPCKYGYCDPGTWFRDFECARGPGFTGATCSENIDDCSGSPCVPGDCIDGVNGYTCCCPENYQGNQSCIEVSVGLIGDACDSQAACVVNGSECRNGTVCGCEAGFSADSTREVCYADCPSNNYGTDFQEFIGYVLSGYTEASFPFTTPEACKQACIDASFLCVSFEHDAYTCYLQTEDASSQPSNYLTADSYTYYQRNCA